jgi:hypothetical protein
MKTGFATELRVGIRGDGILEGRFMMQSREQTKFISHSMASVTLTQRFGLGEGDL